jgi:hypothetical protein
MLMCWIADAAAVGGEELAKGFWESAMEEQGVDAIADERIV